MKLDSVFFKTLHDIYLCGLYMWSDVSPANTVENVDLFEILTNDDFHYEQLGSILLVGDWNCWI